MQRGPIVKRIRFKDYMKIRKLNCTKPNYISNRMERNLSWSGTSPAEGDLSNISWCLCWSCYKLEQPKVNSEEQFSWSRDFFHPGPISSSTTVKCATIMKQLVFLFALLEQGWMKQKWSGWGQSRDQGLFCSLHFWCRKGWTPTQLCFAVQAGQVWLLLLRPPHICLFQRLFFSFMYKTPSPYCIRWK